MKMVGKPDAGNPHVRFDEGGGPLARLYSTNAASLPTRQPMPCGHRAPTPGRCRCTRAHPVDRLRGSGIVAHSARVPWA